MSKKIISLIILLILLVPVIALAKTDWGFSIGGPGFSFGIGSGSGGYGMGGGGWNAGGASMFGLPSGSITGIIMNLTLWILRIFAILGILGFVISGIMYLTSAGDETRMETGKKAMLYSIIGVVVGLLGLIIIQAVDLALNSVSGF